MAKMKLKFNMSGVKKFLIAKGEKVALGLIAVIGLLLVVNGMLSAQKANQAEGGRTWAEALKSAAQTIDAGVQRATLDPKYLDQYKLVGVDTDWGPVLSTFKYNPFIQRPEGGDYKRRNPYAVPVPGNQFNRKNIQVDYIRAGVLVYDVDLQRQIATVIAPRGKKVANNISLAYSLSPERLVLVRAAFPIAEQLEVYKKNLRLGTLGELLRAKEAPPRFLGLNVKRVETDAQGKTHEVDLYTFVPNPKDADFGGSYRLAPHLDKLFRSAVLDTSSNAMILPGLATPLPFLANGKYPPLKLDRLHQEMLAALNVGGQNGGEFPMGGENPAFPMGVPGSVPGAFPGGGIPGGAPGFPGNPIPGAPGEENPPAFQIIPKKEGENGVPARNATPKGDLSFERWSKLEKSLGTLLPRFKGEYFPFDPSLDKTRQGQMGELKLLGQAPADALIRFFDTGIEPGKTYRYKFQVRILNPNFGKTEEVAFQDLAKVREIVSPWTYTPPVSAGDEYFYYAVDQTEKDKKGKTVSSGPDRNSLDRERDRAPVQIHRWLGQVTDNEGVDHIVADWAIAERLLVRPGEYIGRRDTVVKVPRWSKFRSDFEILAMEHRPNKNVRPEKGVVLNFQATNPPPMLVDFDGGKRSRNFLREETAYDLLILTPEGKLIVRNTRLDADATNPDGKIREERLAEFRARIERHSNNLIENDPNKKKDEGAAGGVFP